MPALADLFSVAGRVACVTGASSGIGRVLATALGGPPAPGSSASPGAGTRWTDWQAEAGARGAARADAPAARTDLADPGRHGAGRIPASPSGRPTILVNAAGINTRAEPPMTSRRGLAGHDRPQPRRAVLSGAGAGARGCGRGMGADRQPSPRSRPPAPFPAGSPMAPPRAASPSSPAPWPRPGPEGRHHRQRARAGLLPDRADRPRLRRSRPCRAQRRADLHRAQRRLMADMTGPRALPLLGRLAPM